MKMWRILVSVVLSVLVSYSFFPVARAGSSVVSGHVFFDYNGNGMQDAEEPPLPNVVVSTDNESVSTDESGCYRMGNLGPGQYHISVVSLSSFKFVCTSASEFYDDTTGFDIHVSDATTRTMDIGLMEGFLTLPIQAQATPFAEWSSIAELHGDMPYGVGYVDLDYRPGFMRNFLGNSTFLVDQHQGIDFHAPIGTPVVAAAPGRVVQIIDMYGTDGVRLRNIHVLHESGGRKFITQYGHVRNFQVKEGDWVARGQVLAEVGEEESHLHFAVWEVPQNMTVFYPDIRNYIYEGGYPSVSYPGGDEVPAVVDPYRDVTSPKSCSLWTKDNEPVYARAFETSTSTYTMTASAGDGGVIKPSGTIAVTSGSERRFAIVPNEDHHIKEVAVDGKSVGAVPSYTFTNIAETHTIEATFAVDTYTMDATAGVGGSILPSGSITVESGDSEIFAITPNRGYHIKDVLINGESVGATSTCPVTHVTQKYTIKAEFEEDRKETVVVVQIGSTDLTMTKRIGGQSTAAAILRIDLPPVIKNGRTLVPIRAIIEALGGTVDWEGATRKATVTLGDTSLELWIGKSSATVSGAATPIDSINAKVVPEIINGRTMLPLRFVTENLGATVGWDQTTQTITITYQP